MANPLPAPPPGLNASYKVGSPVLVYLPSGRPVMSVVLLPDQGTVWVSKPINPRSLGKKQLAIKDREHQRDGEYNNAHGTSSRDLVLAAQNDSKASNYVAIPWMFAHAPGLNNLASRWYRTEKQALVRRGIIPKDLKGSSQTATSDFKPSKPKRHHGRYIFF